MILGYGVALNSAALNYTGDIAHPDIVAGITAGALNTAALCSWTRSNTIEITATGAARIYNSFTASATGGFNLASSSFVLHGAGLSSTLNSFTGEASGLAKLGALSFVLHGAGVHTVDNGFTLDSTGIAKWYQGYTGQGTGLFTAGYDPFQIVTPGLHMSGFDSFSAESTGFFTLGYDSFDASGTGLAMCGFDPFEVEATGQHLFNISVSMFGVGMHRVANDLPAYELYRGVDSEPDFTEPWATSDELPFETDVLEPGHEYNFTLRQRNNYNLCSQNIDSWSLSLDDSGEAEYIRPSAPTVSVSPGSGGKVSISATYDYSTDGDYQADQWLIYTTSDGSDPDPESDTPTVQNMSKYDGLARLEYSTEAYGDGDTVKVITRVRRSSESADSTNSEILTATATTAGPDTPAGEVYF